MVKDDLYITVPSFFKCPISLEMMKSPVSLSTGVTYDRASIQRWLDGGNNTCPATMQVLQTKDLIPNHTLHRLIKIWSDSIKNRSKNNKNMPNLPPAGTCITTVHALQLAKEFVRVSPSSCNDKEFFVRVSSSSCNEKDGYDKCFECLSKVVEFAKESDENCREVMSVVEFLSSVITILCRSGKNELGLVCKAIELSNMLLDQCKKNVNLFESVVVKIDLRIDFCSSMMAYMRLQENMVSKLEAVKFIELVMFLKVRNSFRIGQNVDIYFELLRLVVDSEYNSETMEACFSCLVCLSTPRRNRSILAKANAVEVVAKVLSRKELGISTTEKVLKLLEILSSCKEGREKICEDDICVEAIIKKVLKVSNMATEHGVTTLWSLCCLFGDEKAREGVRKSNGMAKILLLMQSNCSASVRQMCCDLLKVFRVGSSKNCFSLLSSYDTKTTHIMPF
ncbi:hypothetical protein LIER_18264 [Lithospermum erythrorhizon]|uniref:U-box domain-containing protein n=1 Tax=Lithospermum erythrorhizon TaxID=34254 RepID=A0AAV3QG53_LITER